MASALDMVAGVGQFGFDPLGDIYEGRKTRFATNEMNRADQARPLMGQALQGDANALQSLAGIDPQSFMEVSKYQQEDPASKADKVASLINWADTPEKWEIAKQRLASNGIELGPEEQPFEARGAMLAEHMSLKQQMEMQKLAGGGNEMGLNPFYWTDAEGNLHASQLSKGGGMEELNLPPGAKAAPGMQMLDAGTGYIPVDKRTGLPGNVPAIPKDLEGEAAAKVSGKETGEAKALYSSLSSKMPGLQKVVADLGVLADKATYTKTGQLWDTIRKETGQKPREEAVARAEYIALVDNQVLPLLRDTFGAAFTVKEGESLRATLGDPDKTPDEKKAVLDAFIEQKVRNLEALAIQGNVETDGADPELEDALSKYQ